MLRHNFDQVARDMYAMRDALRAIAAGEMQAEMLDNMAARGQALVAESFDEQRAPDGSAWAPAARAYGHPLLQKTRAMENSATCEPGPRDDAQGFSLTFSVRDDKAAYHQRGTSRRGGGVHIPARKMIFDPGERPDRWIDELVQVGQASAERWLSARFAF